MNKIILALILVGFFIVTASENTKATEYCYQESANVSTACGGVNDSNSTYTLYTNVQFCDSPLTNCAVVVYKKPAYAQEMLFQVKHGTLSPYNITIGINNNSECWNYNNEYIYLGFSYKITQFTSQGWGGGSHPVCAYSYSDYLGNNLFTSLEGASSESASGTYNSVNQSGTSLWYDGNYSTGILDMCSQSYVSGDTDLCQSARVYEEAAFWVLAPSLNVTFYDEITRQKINFTTINFEYLSGISFGNRTTTNGTIYISNLTFNNYTLRYEDTGGLYFSRSYNFILENQTNNLALYLLNATYTNKITVEATVISNLNEKLEGAIIDARKYDIATNTYISVERVATNFEGRADLSLTTDELYIFVIEYPDGTIVKTTTPTYITDTGITFVVDLGEDSTEDFFQTQLINYNLVFDRDLDSFLVNYSGASDFSNLCLSVVKVNVSGNTFVNQTCSTSSVDFLSVGVPAINSTTYKAYFIATRNGIDYLIDIIEYTYPAFQDMFKDSGMGLFIVLMVTIALTLTATWSPLVALILIPLPLLGASLMGIVGVPVGVALSVELGFIVLSAFISGSRQ